MVDKTHSIDLFIRILKSTTFVVPVLFVDTGIDSCRQIIMKFLSPDSKYQTDCKKLKWPLWIRYHCKQRFFLLSIFMLLGKTISYSQQSDNGAPSLVKVETNKGTFTLRLFDETPLHKQQFLEYVVRGAYDGTIFHRVIDLFMIQGGNLATKTEDGRKNPALDTLSNTIPPEFLPNKYFHKRGALAAARLGDEENPERRSSASQFYIVTGDYYTDMDLDQMEKKYNRIFTPEQRKAYKTLGGAPWLDGEYTIFGEVIDGIEVVEKIGRVPTGDSNCPLKEVVIRKMTVL